MFLWHKFLSEKHYDASSCFSNCNVTQISLTIWFFVLFSIQCLSWLFWWEYIKGSGWVEKKGNVIRAGAVRKKVMRYVVNCWTEYFWQQENIFIKQLEIWSLELYKDWLVLTRETWGWPVWEMWRPTQSRCWKIKIKIWDIIECIIYTVQVYMLCIKWHDIC